MKHDYNTLLNALDNLLDIHKDLFPSHSSSSHKSTSRSLYKKEKSLDSIPSHHSPHTSPCIKRKRDLDSMEIHQQEFTKSKRLTTGLSVYFADSLKIKSTLEDVDMDISTSLGPILESRNCIDFHNSIDAIAATTINHVESPVWVMNDLFHSYTCPPNESPTTTTVITRTTTTFGLTMNDGNTNIEQDVHLNKILTTFQSLSSNTSLMSMTIESLRSLLDTKLLPLKSLNSLESLAWNQESLKKEFNILLSNVSRKLLHLNYSLLTRLDSQLGNRSIATQSFFLDQIHTCISIASDLQVLFHYMYPRDCQDLILRQTCHYLQVCCLDFQSLATGKNEPKIIQLFQNAILLISNCKNCLGESWKQNELPIVTELGLRLCEHVGSLKEYKRSRVYLLMGLVVKFVKTVTTLDEERIDKIKVPYKHVWLMDSIY